MDKTLKELKNIFNLNYLVNGGESRIYKFEIFESIVYGNIELLPNAYILKYVDDYMYDESIENLRLCSNKKLIPKIYVTNGYYLIMDYVEGNTLDFHLNEFDNKKLMTIKLNIVDIIINQWHVNGLTHGDFQCGNIIISNDDIKIIDPNSRYGYLKLEFAVRVERDLKLIDKFFDKLISRSHLNNQILKVP